jgi:hypothetical protein
MGGQFVCMCVFVYYVYVNWSRALDAAIPFLYFPFISGRVAATLPPKKNARGSSDSAEFPFQFFRRLKYIIAVAFR